MSDLTYTPEGSGPRKRIVWLHGENKSPPFSRKARVEVGTLLSRLQDGELLGLPHSRPMPTIGQRCHELRVRDQNTSWRIIYRLNVDAIQVIDVFAKTTRATPQQVIDVSRARLTRFDRHKDNEP